MADEASAAAKGGGGSRFVLWLLVLGLLAAVWWLASERNARRFTTETRDGNIVVGRGRFFPFGSRLLGPADGELWKIYQPLPLPAGVKAVPDREYEEQTELDQALFAQVVAAAKQAAQKSEAASLAQAEALVARASSLPGLSSAQLGELASLRGELALDAARGDATAALKLVRAARARLEDARRAGGDRQPQVAAFAEALDAAAAALDAGAQGRPLPTPAPRSAAPPPPASSAPPSTQAPQRADAASQPPSAPSAAAPGGSPSPAPAPAPSAGATGAPKVR